MGYIIPRILLIITTAAGLCLCLATLFIGSWLTYVSDTFGEKGHNGLSLLNSKLYGYHTDLEKFPESKWIQMTGGFYSNDKFFIARALAFLAPVAASISLFSLLYEIITKKETHMKAAQISHAVLLPLAAASQAIQCYIMYRIINGLLSNYITYRKGDQKFEESWCLYWAVVGAGVFLCASFISWTILSVEYYKIRTGRRAKPVNSLTEMRWRPAPVNFYQNLLRGFSSISDTTLETDYKLHVATAFSLFSNILAMEAELSKRKVTLKESINRCQSLDELNCGHTEQKTNRFDSNGQNSRLSKARLSLTLHHEWPQLSQPTVPLQPWQPPQPTQTWQTSQPLQPRQPPYPSEDVQYYNITNERI